MPAGAPSIPAPSPANAEDSLSLVPQEGLEPPWEYSHYALNVARLPVPPLRRTYRHIVFTYIVFTQWLPVRYTM